MGRLLVRAAVGLGAVVVVGGLAVLGIVLFGRPAVALGRSPTALASVDVGGLGAQVTSVRAVAHGTAVPVTIRDGGVWPLRRLPPGKRVALIVQVAAPGWLQWLVGSSVAMHTQVSTPFPAPTTAVGLVTSERQLRVRFDVPVTEVRYREAGGPAHTIHLASATALVAIPVPLSGYAGTVALAAAADPWERTASRSQTVAWFVPPVRGRPAAVVSPAPGATGTSADSALTITFSEPVAEVLGGRWPTLSPSAPGRWSEPTAYTVRFTPRGMGFGPDTTVVVGFEREVSLVTSPTTLVTGSSYRFTEGPGSILRLQQLLAQIGYLPVTFTPAAGTAEPSTLAAEEATVDRSLPGSFHWRWSGLPSALTSQWVPGQATAVTKGALMQFEAADNTYDYTVEYETLNQMATASVWKALFEAALADHRDPYPYSYIEVTKVLPETLTLWENGQVVLTSLANTGITVDPTADGTYPIYLRYTFQIMRGVNPDGTAYADPVHWINYFDAGEAVHGFVRASYGFPQSLGCVELPVPTAAKIFPKLMIGDLVTVAG